MQSRRPIKPLRPAIFLDRDGTIIAERDYLADPALVELVPGAPAALRELAKAGFALIIVTNQSGIARGLYRERDFEAVQARLLELLGAEGIQLDAVYHCPHHPDYSGPCDCRKPGPGMYRRAQRDLDIDLAKSVYVGDKIKDVQPALGFGGRGVLVRTGHGANEEPSAPAGVEIADDIAHAAQIILGPFRTGPSSG